MSDDIPLLPLHAGQDDTDDRSEREPMLEAQQDEPEDISNQPPKAVTFHESSGDKSPPIEQHGESLARGEKISQHLATSVAGPWMSYASRRFTNLNGVEVDYRASPHRHLIRRPRALLYTPSHTKLRTASIERRPSEVPSLGGTSTDKDGEERSTDDVAKQLGRLELFVDLIYVGIVANLSSNFSEQAFTESGVDVWTATLEFILLFLPIWRIWDYLRSYASNFYVDDVLQRMFTIWILVLALLYGINAPYAFLPNGEDTSLKLLIGIYLVASASFLAINAMQSFFLPYLRRQVLFRFITTLFTSALWIGAIWAPYPFKIVLLILANVAEIPIDVFMASPKADDHLTKGYKRSLGVEHCIERHEEFFIIILGEGVFRLVEGSPTGMGLNSASGSVLTSLLIYYVLHWLYFNGDQSKMFVHALRRTWYKPILWRLLHITLYSALLFLDVSILFLIEHSLSKRELEADEVTDPHVENFIRRALWTGSGALSVVLASITSLALLNRSLDRPGTLWVSSRLVRLAPRFVVVVLILCLPLKDGIEGSEWVLWVVGMLYILLWWEWWAGLEKDWTFFEPKDGDE